MTRMVPGTICGCDYEIGARTIARSRAVPFSAATPGVDRDRGDDDRAGDQTLGGLLRAGLRETGREHGDDQHAEQRSDRAALPAQEARAADDDGGNRLQLEAAAGVGIGRREARRVQHRGERREHAGDGERRDANGPRIDARRPRRARVVADGDEMPAEHGAPQHEIGGDDQRDRRDEASGTPATPAAAIGSIGAPM